MNEDQLSLDQLRSPRTLARSTDEHTSRQAAYSISNRATHLRALLEVWSTGEELSDVEAGRRAGIERVAATRRASELRSEGLIEKVIEDGRTKTTVLPTGRLGMVCVITQKGLDALGGS
jgi:hypothetical protein